MKHSIAACLILTAITVPVLSGGFNDDETTFSDLGLIGTFKDSCVNIGGGEYAQSRYTFTFNISAAKSGDFAFDYRSYSDSNCSQNSIVLAQAMGTYRLSGQSVQTSGGVTAQTIDISVNGERILDIYRVSTAGALLLGDDDTRVGTQRPMDLDYSNEYFRDDDQSSNLLVDPDLLGTFISACAVTGSAQNSSQTVSYTFTDASTSMRSGRFMTTFRRYESTQCTGNALFSSSSSGYYALSGESSTTANGESAKHIDQIFDAESDCVRRNVYAVDNQVLRLSETSGCSSGRPTVFDSREYVRQ